MRVVSLFSDYLESELGIDLEEIEPEEIRILCEDPVFRELASYCLGKTREEEKALNDAQFDRDELGVDPEQDYEDA